MPSVTFRISDELLAFMDERAETKRITRSAWLVRCIEDARKRMAPAPLVIVKPGSRLKQR
jgi:hypothetical protein